MPHLTSIATTRCAALLTSCLLATAAPSAFAEQSHVLRDEFGFEQPMHAMTVTLPDGWSVNGAVQWYGRPSCTIEQMKLHFMATAPGGRKWVEFIPGGAWGWSSAFDAMPHLAQQGFAGCDARPIRNIRTFVDQYIPTIRPGAEVTALRPRPDQAREALESMGSVNLQPGQRPRMEVMEVRLSYDADGQQVNELLMPAILFIDQPAMDAYGGMSGYVTTAMVLGTLASATVDGEADEALLKSVGSGMSYEADYLERLARHFQHKARLMAEAGARKRAAQQAWLASRRAAASSSSNWKVDTSGSDVLDIQMQTYTNTTAMRDAGQARSVDMLHERKPWLNASGQNIYMPQQYQRAYQLPNGVYAGTDDAFFNSVQSSGEFAEPMREAPY